jgi:hypothetical protein
LIKHNLKDFNMIGKFIIYNPGNHVKSVSLFTSKYVIGDLGLGKFVNQIEINIVNSY